LKTDSLFYRLFQNFPYLLFELIDVSVANSEQYQFRSVEIKQTAKVRFPMRPTRTLGSHLFRIDGLFAPPQDDAESPLFFVEVQFSGERDFYSRLFGEIFLYLRQYQPSQPWRSVVIYPTRRVDIGETQHYAELLESPRVRRVYLDELEDNPDSIGISLLQLVILPEQTAVTQARELVTRAKQQIEQRISQRQILELVETIIVYKLPRLSREEIQQMLGFSDIDVKQTRFYQDVYAEAEADLVIRQLSRRCGELDANLVEQIRGLDISQLEELAEALLEFSSQDDLEAWLQQSNV
jgi:predicted transposase/invertase (TIGR01784 family)